MAVYHTWVAYHTVLRHTVSRDGRRAQGQGGRWADLRAELPRLRQGRASFLGRGVGVPRTGAGAENANQPHSLSRGAPWVWPAAGPSGPKLKNLSQLDKLSAEWHSWCYDIKVRASTARATRKPLLLPSTNPPSPLAPSLQLQALSPKQVGIRHKFISFDLEIPKHGPRRLFGSGIAAGKYPKYPSLHEPNLPRK